MVATIDYGFCFKRPHVEAAPVAPAPTAGPPRPDALNGAPSRGGRLRQLRCRRDRDRRDLPELGLHRGDLRGERGADQSALPPDAPVGGDRE